MKLISFGSCFSDEIASGMLRAGYDICVNPFGVLFNPASIASSIERLVSCEPYTVKDVVERAPLSVNAKEDKRQGRDLGYVSFHHHGSFTRESPAAFLENANAELKTASEAFKRADTILVTFGTAWVFRYVGPLEHYKGKVVANCHKHIAAEFLRERMGVEEIVSLYAPLLEATKTDSAKYGVAKRWIFTVSPIRHLADGLQGNQVSKATLILAENELTEGFDNAFYFPSYEIMMDELRDHSWYSEDGKHPSRAALDYIFSSFQTFIQEKMQKNP
ncbi:MAG: GSCFA domain-containing protein [Bacteroidales bacterium]|nr:GSCFA domain-containing protein [Bacteroidales bacterium]